MREHIRRSLSLLLALAMTTSLLGGTAWAAEETTADSSAPVAETAEAADSSESTEEAVASLPAQEAEALGYEDGYTAQKPEGRLYVDGFDSETAARYHLEGLTDCRIMN